METGAETGAGAWMRPASIVLGLLGALLALTAAGYAFVLYMVEGLNGVANPYADRLGFWIAAFALALVAAAGAVLLYRRPRLGSLLLMGGSILGSVAIVLFAINTWYPLAVPLSLLAAVLAARGSARVPGSFALGALSAALLLVAAVASYFFAGIAVAAVCAALFLVACALLLSRPSRVAAHASSALLVLVLAGAVGLAGCGVTSQPQATIPSVTFIATDYAFQAPAALPGGLVSVTMANHGAEPHQAQLARLHEGVTREQLLDALSQNPEAALPLVSLEGGPNLVEPGKSQTVVVNLPAGEYIALCFAASPDGHSHLEKGMKTFFSVGAAGAQQPAEPRADGLVTLRDFGIDLPAQVSAGPITWKVWNHGGQPHELTLFKAVEGQTAQDVMDFLHESEPTGPAPFTSAGGMVALDLDKSGWVQLELTPGEYVAVCFVPDPSSHAPHFAMGMVQPFVVR